MTPSGLTGNMIRSLREKLGLTQQETAEKLGIHPASQSNYERGKRADKDEPVAIPKLYDWALAALARNLRPFSETERKK
jgi:transcriptional regulator with XRE-family HTH domain